MIKLCKICGENFEATKNNQKYCKECKKNSWGKTIELICPNCNKKFFIKKSDYEKTKTINFCSVACRTEGLKIEIECLNCGNVFKKKKTEKKKYCCKKCRSEAVKRRNKERAENDPKYHRICRYCNREFIVYPSAKDKCCSVECKMNWLKENYFCSEEFLDSLHLKGKENFYNKVNKMNLGIEILESYINYDTKIKCKCKTHNQIFYMSPDHILRGENGCTQCVGSKCEKEIERFLKEYGYRYETQKRFDGCKDKRTLPFDFYLKDFNLAIEYDGRGHVSPIPGGNCSMEQAKINLKTIQKHDDIKTKFCIDNNIELLRIPYTVTKDDIYYFLWDEFVKRKLIIDEKLLASN